jgi:arabinogalactan oligomer / maltooligosaccharide transport system permease protein
MTASAASSQSPRTGVRANAWSLPSRAVAVFSGPAGFAVKIALLSIVNAVGLWALVILAGRHQWTAVGLVVAVTAVIDAFYLVPGRAVPAKFLIPGTFFLIAFQVIPVAYTIDVAFTNYSTGHILKKSSAIQQIKEVTLAQSANGKTYTIAPAHDSHGALVLLMVDDQNGSTYVGTRKGLTPVPKSAFTRTSDGSISAATGYTLLKGTALITASRDLSTLIVPSGGDNGIRAEGLSTAVELHPTLRYDPGRDVFTRVSDGAVFHDNSRGSFVHGKEELLPGWKVNVGFLNFSRLIHNKLIRGPFIRVFIWTISFAALTVFLSFALGLFLAITLNKQGLRLRWLYRSALMLPYAIPGFLSLLVWRGLMNDDFGVINKLLGHLGLHVPWLFDANWAKVSVILVSTWLTVPYFFLVSMGALQSIPSELIEAARVDGASAWASFRKVTLPLLLVAVAPLMIASFAFNFNNFGNIYLLTGGGPSVGDNTVAGATDILISYTYKIAFAAGLGQDYGLASAVGIIIFFIVAAISWISFSRTRSLENLA